MHVPASIVVILFVIALNSLQRIYQQRLRKNGNAMDMMIHTNMSRHVTQQSYCMALGNKDGTGWQAWFACLLLDSSLSHSWTIYTSQFSRTIRRALGVQRCSAVRVCNSPRLSRSGGRLWCCRRDGCNGEPCDAIDGVADSRTRLVRHGCCLLGAAVQVKAVTREVDGRQWRR